MSILKDNFIFFKKEDSMDLIIQIKTKEKGIVEKSISGEIYFLKNSLIDVYQNSPEIANGKFSSRQVII